MSGAVSTRSDPRLRWALCGLLLALGGWYAWIGIAGSALPVEAELPRMPLPRYGDRVLVFAPHEDDETLGAAIYMRRAIAAGAQVHVCLMTAGEGEELGAVVATRRARLSPASFVRLGQIRQRETRRALSLVGLPPSHLYFLNYPNMGLTALWSASNWSYQSLWTSRFTRTDHSPFDGGLTPGTPFCGASVLRDVEAVLEAVKPTQVFTVHPADTHPDHWPTYGFVKLALEDLRVRKHSTWASRCRLYTYLVHRPRWPVPWGYYPDLPLMPPAPLLTLPLNRWLALPLQGDDVAVKNRMILTYRSQMARYDMLLRAFARRNELFAEVTDLAVPREELATQAAFLEPTGDSRYLLEHKAMDLAEVGLWSDGERLEIRVKTQAAHSARVNFQAVLHVIDPAPDTQKTIQVSYRPGHLARGTSADDQHGPAAIPALTGCATTDGDTTTITLPYAYVGNGRPVMVDVTARLVRADHALTRTVFLPPGRPLDAALPRRPPRPATKH